jgi:hypothetical protein
MRTPAGGQVAILWWDAAPMVRAMNCDECPQGKLHAMKPRHFQYMTGSFFFNFCGLFKIKSISFGRQVTSLTAIFPFIRLSVIKWITLTDPGRRYRQVIDAC